MNSGTKYIQFASQTENPHFEGVFDIGPHELKENLNNVKLIDVRQPDEYTGELGHIADSELIVLDTLPEKLDSVSKDKTIVFVCRSGGRSARAAAFALSNGFTSVFNLQGGMMLWNELQLPINK